MVPRAKLLSWLGFLHMGLAFFTLIDDDAKAAERKVLSAWFL